MHLFLKHKKFMYALRFDTLVEDPHIHNILDFYFFFVTRLLPYLHHNILADTNVRRLSTIRNVKVLRTMNKYLSPDENYYELANVDFGFRFEDCTFSCRNESFREKAIRMEASLYSTLLICMKRYRTVERSECAHGLLSYNKQRSLWQTEAKRKETKRDEQYENLPRIESLEPIVEVVESSNSDEVDLQCHSEIPGDQEPSLIIEDLREQYLGYQALIFHQELLEQETFLQSYLQWIKGYLGSQESVSGNSPKTQFS